MVVKRILKKIIPSYFLDIYHDFLLKQKIRMYKRVQSSYPKLEKSIRKQVLKRGKLRIGFYVVYSASWGSRPLFEKMQSEDLFDVKILVCPDTIRGVQNQFEVMNKVYNEFATKYGEDKVICSYNYNKKLFQDFSDQFDLIFIANPYDGMTYKYYGTKFLSHKKKKLLLFCDYGYSGKLKYELGLYKTDSYNLVWKNFVDNESTKKTQQKEQYIGDCNVVVSGSCKMDKLVSVQKKTSQFIKTIIIAPHHTVRTTINGLNISNFLKYSELFLQLPELYPQIKFIFRPHPLLFTTLRCEDLWGNEKVENYLAKMTSFSNVEYSTEGEYFDCFVNSDAMIDDCGSFLAEYFYVNKPQCYMLQNESSVISDYLDFGKNFFNYVYKAYSENDIIQFIENVVLGENDYLRKEREQFAKNEVMINYPNVSDFIISYIKNKLF